MTYDVVFTLNQFIQILEHIADDLPTAYNNNFPQNCGYYTGNAWTWDCWNLIKTIIWGWNEDTTIGSYTYRPDYHGLGDWTGLELLNHCYNVSLDFTNIDKGTYLYYNGTVDHAGIYIGTKIVDGKTVNVIEATPIWNNGVQYSYVDTNGVRYQYQGATPSITWTAYGKLPWINYSGRPIRKKLPVWMMYKYPLG